MIKISNPEKASELFNPQMTAILRPLCQALYDLNLADADGTTIPHVLANQDGQLGAYGHVFNAIGSCVESVHGLVDWEKWEKFMNYGGNEDFFMDLVAAVWAAIHETEEE